MNPLDFFSYIQLTIFILGVLTILIAGYQDKKSRLAPAIYFSPTLIGFGLNPLLGLVGMVGTMIALFLWKDSWNEKIGLADALLFFVIIMCVTNLVTIMFTSIIVLGVLFELLLLKKEKQPLVWLTAKWILITLILFISFSLLQWWFL